MKTKYILKRVLIAIPTFFGITVLAYIISSMAPGSPLDMLLADPRMTAEEIARREVALGLDKPVIVQYFTWLGQFFAGEPGLLLPHGASGVYYDKRALGPHFAFDLFFYDAQYSGGGASGNSGCKAPLFCMGLHCLRPVVSDGCYTQFFCRADFHLSVCCSMEHSSHGRHV